MGWCKPLENYSLSLYLDEDLALAPHGSRQDSTVHMKKRTLSEEKLREIQSIICGFFKRKNSLLKMQNNFYLSIEIDSITRRRNTVPYVVKSISSVLSRSPATSCNTPLSYYTVYFRQSVIFY